MRAACLALCLTLTACTQFPDLDGTISPALAEADYPALVPLDPLLASAIPATTDTAQTTQNLESRIASLRARARALQAGAVVDDGTRTRLRDRIN